jgi:aryl-alcohol dehydrogenase-like predicted oxidoreductase
MTLPDLALRFILANPDVDVVIPGMRKPENVRANVAAGESPRLPEPLIGKLRRHRWDRKPAPWSA